MARLLTENDGRTALKDHILTKAAAARRKHGPRIDHATILNVLDDREIVRYPVEVRFDAAPLVPGELAYPAPRGDHPSDGFCLFIHPSFEARPDDWALLIAYYIAPVNYGEIADSDACELLGASLLGLDVEVFYRKLCAIADSIAPSREVPSREMSL